MLHRTALESDEEKHHQTEHCNKFWFLMHFIISGIFRNIRLTKNGSAWISHIFREEISYDIFIFFIPFTVLTAGVLYSAKVALTHL